MKKKLFCRVLSAFLAVLCFGSFAIFGVMAEGEVDPDVQAIIDRGVPEAANRFNGSHP